MWIWTSLAMTESNRDGFDVDGRPGTYDGICKSWILSCLSLWFMIFYLSELIPRHRHLHLELQFMLSVRNAI